MIKKKIFGVLLAATVVVSLFTACSNQSTESTADSSSATTETENTETVSYAHLYSAQLDDDGYISGVDYETAVTLPKDIKALNVAKSEYAATQEEIDAQINSILDSYTTNTEITDQKVKDGDSVNIDYVGSIDGVEFSGGSTGGAGTTVTIGVTSYIDDFLEQLIGHTPGETVNVEVTFPEDYGNEELNGKDAVFVTVINYIVGDKVVPEFTDEFVSTNLTSTHGWKTAQEATAEITADLESAALSEYVLNYLIKNSVVNNVPQEVIDFQMNTTRAYYQEIAAQYGVTEDEFAATYLGAETIDAFLEQNNDAVLESANEILIIEAFCKAMDISVDEAGLTEYFETNVGISDYSDYITRYGIPYLKYVVIYTGVNDLLLGNVVSQ